MGGFNGNGVFQRSYSWSTDAANSININTIRMDVEDNGFASGLSNCITRDGQSPALANLPMGGFNVSGLGTANANGQAVEYAQYLLTTTTLTFLPAGVSPYSRSLQAKFRDFIHAADYGVVANDGTTDETTQFKAAIAAAILLKKRLYFDGLVVLSGSLLNYAVNYMTLAIQGSGMYSARIINKTVGSTLFNIGNTYYTHLEGFSIEGNGLTGASGNGHAISMIQPGTIGTGTFLPQYAKIHRVRVVDHKGLDVTYASVAMPACAIYGAGDLGTKVSECYFEDNGFAHYAVQSAQPTYQANTYYNNRMAAAVFDQCEKPTFLPADVVGTNTQDTGGSLVVGNGGAQTGGALTMFAGAVVDFESIGGEYRGGKYKNHQHAALSLASRSHPLVTGAYIRQDVAGCEGVRSIWGARIIANEFSYSGGAFVGTRYCVHVIPSSAYNEIGEIRGNKITFAGNGDFGNGFFIDASGVTGASGTIANNTAGDANAQSGASTFEYFIKVSGGVRNLAVRDNFLSASSGLTVASVYDFSGINNQLDQGLTDHNNGAWNNGAGTITSLRSGPGFGGYFGLQQNGRLHANGFARSAPVSVNAATYTWGATDTSARFTTTNCTLTLPSAAANNGVELTLSTITANSVISASSNVVPLGSVTPGTAILVATAGKFAKLVSDGTNWITEMAN